MFRLLMTALKSVSAYSSKRYKIPSFLSHVLVKGRRRRRKRQEEEEKREEERGREKGEGGREKNEERGEGGKKREGGRRAERNSFGTSYRDLT